MSGMKELALARGATASAPAPELIREPTAVQAPAVYERPSVPATPASDAASLMAVITRIAENPEIDLARIEKMLDMYERVAERQAKAAYTAALAEMQPELPVIDERGRIEVREKDGTGQRTGRVQQSTPYALWEDINDAIRPVLARHGFALTFRTGMTDDGRITVTGALSHREGHSEETTMILPHDSTGSKNAVQAIGSSTSYGKRYTAAALLNITSRGEDDDGRAGGGRPLGIITDAQRDALNILADEADADKRRFCEFWGINSIAELPAACYQPAERMLREKLSARLAKQKAPQ